MSLLDDIKAKADANGDGKVDLKDLEALRTGDNGHIIDALEKKIAGKDGKLGLDDIKNINFDTLGSVAGDIIIGGAKDSLLGNIFGGKKK